MTEEELRAIVRDEVEQECLREGGIYDTARKTAFAVAQSVTEIIGKRMIDLFGNRDKEGLN